MRKRAFIVICAHGSTIPTAQRVSHSPIQSVDFRASKHCMGRFTRGSERRRELFALLVCTYLDTVRTISMQGLSARPRGTRQRLTAAHDSTTAAGRRQQRQPTRIAIRQRTTVTWISRMTSIIACVGRERRKLTGDTETALVFTVISWPWSTVGGPHDFSPATCNRFNLGSDLDLGRTS